MKRLDFGVGSLAPERPDQNTISRSPGCAVQPDIENLPLLTSFLRSFVTCEILVGSMDCVKVVSVYILCGVIVYTFIYQTHFHQPLDTAPDCLRITFMIINYHNHSICASASGLSCIGRIAPVY